LLALSQLGDVGPQRQGQLVRACGSARQVFEFKENQLKALPFLNPKQVERIAGFSAFDDCARRVDVATKLGIKIVNLHDDQYPYRLREIVNSPVQLFYRGSLEPLKASHVLAIVGARRMTTYGKRVIEELIKPLVEKGIVIVSGMAFGVDVAGHRECLKQAGRTVAVQAQGVDKGYPRAHQGVFDQVIGSGGCVLSEFGLMNPDWNEKFLFPRRNRIISGLSDAVLIVEAAEKSGALITARFASEQNRDVFAIPGSIHQPMSRGCLELIKQGAKPIITPEDIFEEFALRGAKTNKNQPADRTVIPKDLFESPLEENIFTVCRCDSKNLDDIIDAVSEPASFVTATVTKMLLLGRLREVEGKRFVSEEM